MNRSLLPSAIFCLLVLATLAAGCTTAQQANMTPVPSPVTGSMISITADGKTYPAYIAVPTSAGKHPGIVLLHSFNGLEPGYKVMCDRMATDGFVVIAPEWQTFGRQAGDLGGRGRGPLLNSSTQNPPGCRCTEGRFNRILRRGKVHDALPATV